MKRMNATVKGVITALVMIGALTLAMKLQTSSDNFIFVIYLLFSAGIIWTLLDFKKNGDHRFLFKTFFNEGFKCFIVVVLFMMVYVFIITKVNIDTVALKAREEMLAEKTRTPAEIDTAIVAFKKNSPIFRAGVTMFQYLVIGALVTGIASGFLSKREEDRA